MAAGSPPPGNSRRSRSRSLRPSCGPPPSPAVSVQDMGTDPQPGLASGRRLSFSVDRILSKEVGGRQPSRPSLPSTIPNTDVGVCRDWCCDRPAVLRCCQPSHHHHQTYFQPHHHHFLQQASLPHAPKPIRPFPAKFQVKVSYRGPESEDLLAAAGKRKRSWSRAVFSSLQRKGLEKRFQIQQYITKPDRRQLAATLGLTDAQVKVWFQNRRMKWRHTKEMKGAGVPCQQRLTASSQPPQGQV